MNKRTVFLIWRRRIWLGFILVVGTLLGWNLVTVSIPAFLRGDAATRLVAIKSIGLAIAVYVATRLFTNAESDIMPIDPESATLDVTNPEVVLEAAAVLDQRGDWKRAVELYELVLRKWPSEHGHYAQNCIAEVRNKLPGG